MPTKDERERAIREMETPEERAAREQAGLQPPASNDNPDGPKRRGRPPGSTNKPKLSDETLHFGCIQLVKICWLVCYPICYLFGWELSDLSDEEIESGAKEAKHLASKFAPLIYLLMMLGFPLWLVRAVSKHLHRKEQKPAAQITLVADEKKAGAP